MRGFARCFAGAAAALVLGILLANRLLFPADARYTDGAYRVEIARLTDQIAAGACPPDLSDCRYVFAVTPVTGADDLITEAHYALREVNGQRYRFSYRPADNRPLRLRVNAILTAAALAVLGVLLAVWRWVLRPFQRLRDVPAALAKGDLTVPLPAEKGRFFGQFVWGVNLLRVHLESQRTRELELQREKKTLLLSLSHDIKTPLSAIKLSARALSGGLYPDPEKQRETARQISAHADEIEGYVTGIIEAARENPLRLEVSEGEFYLSDLLHEISAYYSEKLALQRTEFILPEYDDCLLSGDRARSIEVMQNLMENALKYGDGCRIELTCAEEEDCRLVGVRNTGCTLTEAELPHIFESFWRGSNAAGRPGSGLGLSICRQLMHAMHGDVFAELSGGEITVTAVFQMA